MTDKKIIEISETDLGLLEDLLFGIDFYFIYDWDRDYKKELREFFKEIRKEMKSGLEFDLPRIFKERLESQ